MNPLFLRTSAALLSIGMLAHFSAQAASDEAAAPQRVEITAPRASAAMAEAVLALRDVDAAYELSNGRRMVVTSYGDVLTMRYAKRAPRVLRHDGQGKFVTADGAVALSFELDDSGQPQFVRLSAAAGWF